MIIAGYEVEVTGEVLDEDAVLIEDAVLFLNGKVSQTELKQIKRVRRGYDLTILFKNKKHMVKLRRDVNGEWIIELPQAIEKIVSKMPI